MDASAAELDDPEVTDAEKCRFADLLTETLLSVHGVIKIILNDHLNYGLDGNPLAYIDELGLEVSDLHRAQIAEAGTVAIVIGWGDKGRVASVRSTLNDALEDVRAAAKRDAREVSL